MSETSTALSIPPVLRRLCDDAAIFPPGLVPLPEAVPAHERHVRGPHGALVGPFVLGAARLLDLPPLVQGRPAGSLDIAVTVPAPDGVQAVVTTVALLPPLRLRALEVAVPPSMAADAVVPALDGALAGMDVAGGALDVYVEVPRDDRRPDLLAALAGSPYRAKFRTGGVEADLVPGEAELARAVLDAVARGLAFKATAGLHHAVRAVDPEAGLDQHGFLNLMLATDAALRGGSEDDLVAILAERDGAELAARFAGLDDERGAALRRTFVSFGTCSITDPLDDLVDLGLVGPAKETP